jgi:tetrahydrodipicolinate N-succinyltransferase
MLGGVLEPVGAPVIVEDEVLIGATAGLRGHGRGPAGVLGSGVI